MIRPVSRATEVVYRNAAKPILFKIAPDSVHTQLLRSAAFLQKSRLVCRVVGVSWAYRNDPVLRQVVHGISFRNPVGLSAGFDKNFVVPPIMRAIGFGFMEGGSLTLHVCEGNPKPWFYRLPKSKSLVVHVGLANHGVDAICRRLKGFSPKQTHDFPLNISVAKTNSPQAASENDAVEDYIGSLQKLQKERLGNMITLNISCPNTYGGEPFTTPSRLEHLLREVDRLHLATPTFIKMPSSLSWVEFHGLLRVIAKHHIDGLIIGNLVKDRRKAKLSDSLPVTMKGGLSGRPTQKITNELICRTYQTYGKRFVIIGVGGIFSAKDAYEKITLGASLVELITGMIFEGPQLVGQINQGLVELLHRDGFTHISEAIGTRADYSE